MNKHPTSPEDDRKPLAKRLKSTPLSLDALTVVLEFLHPRDLLHTAFASKALKERVTTRLVVQSALVHGGHAKKSMEELHALTSVRSIHVPSPLRLLRIANGKVCEFCREDKVNHVRPGIGVFACWDCVTCKHLSHRYAAHWQVGDDGQFSLTRPWKRSWVRYRNSSENRVKYDAIFDHPRVAASEYGANLYVWSAHRSDLAGERVGPLVCWGDVDDMVHRHESADAMISGGIDDYLATRLNAPPSDRYREFNDAFTEMQTRAREAALEREQIKKARKAKTKAAKLTKAHKMLDDLTALIDEDFRGFALKRAEDPWFHNPNAKISDSPCIRLESPFIHGLLKPYIITPSKMKKSTLREIADTINGKLRMIAEKKLLAMQFLSNSDAFEAALKQYFIEKLPNLEALFDFGRHQKGCDGTRTVFENKITAQFMSLLEADRLVGALCSLLNGDLSPVLLATDPIRSAANVHGQSTIERLADHAWRESYDNLGRREEGDDSKFSKTFHASQGVLKDAFTALDEYSSWLLERNVEESGRTNLLKNAASYSYVNALLKRDFDGLSRTWFQSHQDT
ncbi:hypothetical protein ACHAWF_006847 [Thalassiosira exigua]